MVRGSRDIPEDIEREFLKKVPLEIYMLVD